jgi:hypothetical protein
MKLYLLLAILVTSIITSHGQNLSDADREALLKKLQTIQKQAESAIDTKYRNAMSAFGSAMNNENSALELYLKCEELINFEKKNKKTADFRDWKKNNNDKFLDTSFRLALQYQLRWTVLTLQASSENADRDKLSIEASKIIDAIINDAEKLAPYQSVLNQSVLSSVFAQAYKINGIEIKNWPLAPGQLDAVYDEILLPPLRRADRISSLTSCWQKRMNHQGEIVLKWKSEGKSKSGENSLEYEKFITETLPQLRWDADVDIFKAGDQRGASIRMLKHIEDNIGHKSATKWAQNFNTLIETKPIPAKNTPEVIPSENKSE